MLNSITFFLILLFCNIILCRNIQRREIALNNYSKESKYLIKNSNTFITENVKTDLSKVHFYLHTNDNPGTGESDELIIGDTNTLHNSHYKANGGLFLLIHGFGADIYGWFPYGTGNDLLKTDQNGNVILLDWSELVDNGDYIGAVKNGYAVSNHTAKFLKFLMDENVVTPEKIHCIGFSLGAQTCGILGKRFQWFTDKTIGRITSLDPAWPLFDIAEDDDRISSDDGDFVDVIHTNGGGLGMVQPRGHVDFYPNGGRRQPGCGLDPVGNCAHARAAAFFKESILGKTEFKSCKCENWDEFESGNCSCNETANLGYNVDKRARGSFYLRTNKQSPYAKG